MEPRLRPTGGDLFGPSVALDGSGENFVNDGNNTLYDPPYEERQRKPDDREAQEGQRPIAVHALENLVWSDRGVVMFRRRLRESLELIAQGKDPLNVIRDPEKNHRLETSAFNTVRPPAAKRGCGLTVAE